MNCPEGAKLIPLTQGKFAIVDEEDYELISKFKWRAHNVRKEHGPDRWYALCTVHLGMISGKQVQSYIHLHRLIMHPPKGMDTDHIDRNGLNCRRSNMRICTRTQNNQSGHPHCNTSSQFKGVSWHRRSKRWVVHLTCNKRLVYNDSFVNEIEAAHAYDRAVIKYCDEFAYTNFPRKDYENGMEPNMQVVA